MEIVGEPDENEGLDEDLDEEKEKNVTSTIKNRRNITVDSIAAVREESKNDIPDDTDDDKSNVMPIVEMDADSKDSDDSDYEYKKEEGMNDDGDYVPDKIHLICHMHGGNQS
eukprot:981473-Ditylum_brightwellii.AAC.1